MPSSDPETTARLVELEQSLRRAGAPVVDALAPGVRFPEDVERTLGTAGLAAPAGLVSWFMWHDGLRGGVLAGPSHTRSFLFWTPLSLQEALDDRRSRDLGHE